ncbi:hypothetical protein WJX74_002819 [Apatococcus lobatus]|uniref:Sodium/hydrogen exchanger n=1 Tax=Apatococcus lobatus TaxID=904363 RepID=A0AAW1QAP4_9CHLO
MQEGYVSRELTLVWILLIVTVIVTFFIQRYRITYIPPSGAAMVLGILVGSVMKLSGLAETVRFSAEAFFYGLLPPIVFAAGFTLKKKDFFKNFGTISVYAVGGTLISALVFGLLTYGMVAVGIVKRSHLGSAPLIECMLYGSLISATDPVATLSVFSELQVPPLLYNLVFGESVLNDATAIVLFRTLTEFYATPVSWSTLPLMVWRFITIGLGSLGIGIAIALACAFILKRFQLGPGSDEGPSSVAFNGTVYEISLVVMSAYLAYLVAETVNMSGIVALFFTAICHAHYSFYSVAEEAQIALKRCFEFAAFLSETFVFAFLGLQVATLSEKQVDAGLLITGVPLVLLARAANIFPLSYLLNMKGRRLPLPYNLQTIMWAVGLRGAVAYGLAVNLPQINEENNQGMEAIESATLVIVVISTIVFGGLTGPLLKTFNLHGVGDVEVHAMGLQDYAGLTRAQAIDHVNASLSVASSSLHGRWKSLDRNFLKPVFGGRAGQATRVSAGDSDDDEDQVELLGGPGAHGQPEVPLGDLPGPDMLHAANGLAPMNVVEYNPPDPVTPGARAQQQQHNRPP